MLTVTILISRICAEKQFCDGTKESYMLNLDCKFKREKENTIRINCMSVEIYAIGNYYVLSLFYLIFLYSCLFIMIIQPCWSYYCIFLHKLIWKYSLPNFIKPLNYFIYHFRYCPYFFSYVSFLAFLDQMDDSFTGIA